MPEHYLIVNNLYFLSQGSYQYPNRIYLDKSLINPTDPGDSSNELHSLMRIL